jgi:Caspase domain
VAAPRQRLPAHVQEQNNPVKGQHPMSRFLPSLRAGALLFSVLALMAAPVQARRLALVIGNDSYQNVATLQNARADARAIAAALKESGFEVTLKQDLTQKAMKSALRDFKALVAGGDEVVFYFSGHGVQFGGSNYLVPIDITAESEAQVADDAIPLQRVLDDMTEQKARFSLAIIDACRNNPFKQNGRALGGRGLAVVNPATGQMIMYSAGAGQTALDKLGPNDTNPNGVFTRVLIQEMKKPGVPAGVMLKDVQSDVVEMAHSIGHEQVPALYDQSLGKFYFRSGAPGAVEAGGVAGAATAVHVPTAAELDESYWQGIKGSTVPADYSGYISSFPKGMHVAEARMMSTRLTRAASTKAGPAPSAPAAAIPAVAHPGAAAKLSPGGPYPAWGTTSLLPGVVGTGSVTINSDGTLDTLATNGDRTHATLNVSDANNVSGTSITHLGSVGGVQRRYPDGSTSTQVTFRGRLANGKITGTYYDKFQTGQFEWTVAP